MKQLLSPRSGPSASAGSTLAGLTLAVLLCGPTGARADQLLDSKKAPVLAGWSASAWLTQEYRFRTAGAPEAVSATALGEPPVASPSSDQDLRLTIDGTVTGLHDRAAATLSAALWIDVDGHVPQGDPDLFGDSQGLAQPLGVIYALTAEWRRSQPLERLALGRQQAMHGLPVTFDGGALDLRFLERRLLLFAFGGHTVHFFQTEPGFFENWLASAGAGFRITPSVQLEIDSRFLHEQVLGQGGDPGATLDTNSYGATVTARWDTLQGKLFARGMNRDFSHVGGAFHLQVPNAAVGVDGQATAQLATLGEIAESESPFYSLLGNSLPHLRARLEAWKDFRLGAQGSFALAIGSRFRQLLSDQPTRFNRNMNVMYARGDLNDLPWRGAYASISAEWNLPTQPADSTRFFTVGGAAGYLSWALRAEAGTYYQRFKINYYRDVEELADARTVFAMASYRVLPPLEVRARYVLEIVDRTIHSLYLTLREDF